MFKKSCVCTQVFDDIATATAYAITSVHPRSVFGQTGPIVQIDIGHARLCCSLALLVASLRYTCAKSSLSIL